MRVSHDTAVGLLGLALVRDGDGDADGVARQHWGYDADLAAEIGHAGAVDQPRLHDEPLGEREGECPWRGLALEDRLARHVLHVVEERLVEAAEGYVGAGGPPRARPGG